VSAAAPSARSLRQHKLSNWPGAAGVYTFLPNGDVNKSLVVQSWKDGKLTPVEIYEKSK
jgi:hypothetical protein